MPSYANLYSTHDLPIKHSLLDLQLELEDHGNGPTSFFSPGIVFVGEQQFIPHDRGSASASPSSLFSLPSLPSPPSPLQSHSPIDNLRQDQRTSEQGFTSSVLERASYRQRVDDALVGSSLERIAPPSGPVSLPAGETWAVKVVIQSYFPSKLYLTGLMHAFGVPSSKGRVTTYFKGEILDPTSCSLLRLSQEDEELDYWVKLGPFKGLSKSELKKNCSNKDWMKVKCKGWLLCRWKEKEFVNISPAESSLSISGHYYIALNRHSGHLEGLYYDPVTTPFQRLILSPDSTNAQFNLGTFGYQ